MPNTAVAMSPRVLRWAREQAALSVQEVARRLGKDSTDIEEWEGGDSAPTYVQLEKLAYEIYKRPLALFFFPEPPVETDLQQEFRTLPDEEFCELLPDTRLAIREALARRASLEEVCGGSNPAERFLLREVQVTAPRKPEEVAGLVRGHLQITMREQESWRSTDAALKSWREAVERAGVFVFKRSLRQKSISGFCLANAEFPVVYLNNSTPQTRQIFTLFHELAHALLCVSGITFRDDQFIERLDDPFKAIEIFCNRFAGEVLVPSDEFARHRSVREWSDEQVSSIADSYKVSREVVLRRALDWGLVSKEFYRRKAREWADQAKPRDGGGGDYYATQATYFGQAFLTLLFTQRQRGRFSIEEVAEHLGMKVPNALKLEDYFLTRSPEPNDLRV